MDGPWAQNAVCYFGLCLPASMTAWVVLALSQKWLSDPREWPGWFRFIAVRAGDIGRRQLTTQEAAGSAVGAVLIWLFFNFPPFAILLLWPYGWLGRLLVLAYGAAQAVWVYDLRRAIVRGRAHSGRANQGP